jgi:hypothetical protein
MRRPICSLMLAGVLVAANSNEARLASEVASRGWIVYSAKTGKGDWDLFLMRPDGSARRNITNTPGFHEIGGRFSPDGRRMLWRRIPPDVKVHHDWWGRAGQLVIANADGSSPLVYGEFPWASWSQTYRSPVNQDRTNSWTWGPNKCSTRPQGSTSRCIVPGWALTAAANAFGET